MAEVLKNRIKQLDQDIEELLKQGKHLDSLDKMEEGLNLRKEIFGEKSDEFNKMAEKISETCNLLAIMFLNKDKNDACYGFLRKAEVLSQQSISYRALTYNNMACFFRKIGKNRVALSYLQQTLELEAKNNNLSNLADTYLNICAVLSQLGKHEEALQKSLLAIAYLQDELLRTFLPETLGTAKQNKDEPIEDGITEENKEKSESSSSESEKHTSQGNQSSLELSQSKNSYPLNINEHLQDRIAITAIAYHNMAVEFEYLNRLDEALKTYEKAAKFAEDNLGKSHSTSEDLRKVCNNASRQISLKRDKQLDERKKDEEKIQVKEKKTKNIINKMSSTYNGTQSTKALAGQGPLYKRPMSKFHRVASATNSKFNSPSNRLDNAKLEKQKKQAEFKIKSSSTIKSGTEAKSHDSHMEIEIKDTKNQNLAQKKEESQKEHSPKSNTSVADKSKKMDKKSSFEKPFNMMMSQREESGGEKTHKSNAEGEQEEFGVVNHQINLLPIAHD